MKFGHFENLSGGLGLVPDRERNFPRRFKNSRSRSEVKRNLNLFSKEEKRG